MWPLPQTNGKYLLPFPTDVPKWKLYCQHLQENAYEAGRAPAEFQTRKEREIPKWMRLTNLSGKSGGCTVTKWVSGGTIFYRRARQPHHVSCSFKWHRASILKPLTQQGLEGCSGVDAVLGQNPSLALETLTFPAVPGQFRSRSIELFGQFNGQKCVDAVGDRRQCVPTEICEDPEDDCKNDFRCHTGNSPVA